MQIQDKRVVVTGAASGIGKALCEEATSYVKGQKLLCEEAKSYVKRPSLM